MHSFQYVTLLTFFGDVWLSLFKCLIVLRLYLAIFDRSLFSILHFFHLMEKFDRLHSASAVHSSKGVLVVNEQRWAKGDAAKVSEAGGEVTGTLSSCNSLEVRFQVQGRVGLYKVFLASIRSGLTSVERPSGRSS